MGMGWGPRDPREWKLLLRGSRGDRWKQMLRDSRGDGKIFYGIPEGAVFDFIVHLHRQNAFNIHFFRTQNVGCLITMITQIGTSPSANVEFFIINK